MRIITTPSKEDSFKRLKDQRVAGAIAPELVGVYFAKQMGLKVKTIGSPDQGADVSITVKKGNKLLLDKINQTIEKIKKTKKIDRILSKYDDK